RRLLPQQRRRRARRLRYRGGEFQFVRSGHRQKADRRDRDGAGEARDRDRRLKPDRRMTDTFTLSEVEAALPIVRAAVPPTPQYAWPLLRSRTGVDVVVKHENHTPVGAFKVRGGLVYFDRLRQRSPKVKGIVTATRGNHGQSFAFAGSRSGVPVTIVVPHGNSTEKNAAMRAFGAELIEHGVDFDAARAEAAALAERQ